MAILPTGEEVQFAQVVTPLPAETQVATAPEPTLLADSSSSHGEQTAVDRAAGNDGPRRGGHRAYRRKAPSLVC